MATIRFCTAQALGLSDAAHIAATNELRALATAAAHDQSAAALGEAPDPHRDGQVTRAMWVRAEEPPVIILENRLDRLHDPLATSRCVQ
jgi:hypothetical protein